MAKKGDEIVYRSKRDSGVTRERKQVLVDRALHAIVEERGTVTTAIVLEEASKPEHPLHAFFEWRDDVAARKWREVQCYQLIQSCRAVATIIERQGDGPPQIVGTASVRELVSPFRSEGFRMRREALNEVDSRRALIERKVGQLRSWCRESIDISALDELRTGILERLPPE